MNRTLAMLLLFAMIAHSWATASDNTPIILGYYPSWVGSVPPEKINYPLYTHIAHAFLLVDKNGILRPDGNVPSPQLTSLAHKANVRVLLSIGGEDSGGGFAAATQTPEDIERFVKDSIRIAQDNRYDGIDIDWESPHNKTETLQSVALIRALRTALNDWKPGALLTMAVPAVDYYGRWFDGSALEPHVDFIQVMTYELHGPWKNDDGSRYSHAGHNSPLGETDLDPIDGHRQSFARFVQYWQDKGFPKNKILVGIPCFGRGFAVGQFGEEPLVKSPHNEVPYNRVPALLKSGWIRHWDAQGGVPWLTSPNGKEIISYDDPESAAGKAAWAQKAQLRGIFFWEITQDYANDGKNSIVQSAHDIWTAPASSDSRP
jgi:chitinase